MSHCRSQVMYNCCIADVDNDVHQNMGVTHKKDEKGLEVPGTIGIGSATT